MPSKFIHRAEDIPAGEHWAILTSSGVSVPGDDRSREAPGHGYPAHTENFMTYEAFTNKAEFEGELERQVRSAMRFGPRPRGIHVTGTYHEFTTVKVVETVGASSKG